MKVVDGFQLLIIVKKSSILYAAGLQDPPLNSIGIFNTVLEFL